MFWIILFIIIFLIYNDKQKTEKSIKAFHKTINKSRVNLISVEQSNEFHEKYKPLFLHCTKMHWQTEEIKSFIYLYNNLDKKIIEWNKEFEYKESIKKNYEANTKATDALKNKLEKFNDTYFTSKEKNQIKTEFSNLYNFFNSQTFQLLNLKYPEEFMNTYRNLDYIQQQSNLRFIQNESEKYSEFFDDIDGKSLDMQQRTAVITDDTNNLILAGAGSGKTLTIAAKVKYLVEKKNVKPEDILLISFTNKAAEEMTNRIQNKLNIPVTAVTFHKLGLSILKQHQAITLIDNMNGIISEYFKTNILNDFETLKNIFNFFLFYLNVPKDLQDFDTLGSYIDSQRTYDLETLKSKYDSKLTEYKIEDMKSNLHSISGERLKSTEEVMIANYLFLNGIKYEYEREYPFKEEDAPNKKYHPDFYLPGYDIWLEHFGITKDNTLPWLTEIEEQKYLDDMKWKRNFHKKNGTKLLETYSYYNYEKRLIPELQKLLDENNIQCKPKDIQEIYKKVYANDEDYHFKEFEKLITTFITLYKANGYALEDIGKFKMYDESHSSQRNNSFIDIIKPILKYYEENLKDKNGIDFNDMINQATTCIKEQNTQFNYKYIIIDEYQDISVGRYKLIKEIINHSDAKLVCVGDDWQSIYRFSGSDLNLFSKFEEYFGETSLLRIEKTYRNSQELLNIASKFILQNKEQLTKNLKSDKTISNPIVVMSYSQNEKLAVHTAITDICAQFGEDAEILLLGRTAYDINDYMDEYLRYYPSTNTVKYLKYPDLKIKFLTVHASKGLEADNVIILNMKNSLMGFPNKISDDEVLSLVLQNKDTYEYAEERRLFYVAITRTKNRTYLIAPEQRASIFLNDLNKITNLCVCKNINEESYTSNPTCPRCKTGYLVIKEHNKKQFLGCSNYPYCEYALKETEVLETHIKCKQCGGYLVKRKR